MGTWGWDLKLGAGTGGWHSKLGCQTGAGIWNLGLVFDLELGAEI